MTGGGHRRKRASSRWWSDGALSRPGARRRYATVLVIVLILVSLPAIVGALPVSARSVPTATLLQRIRASATVPFSGLASSSGQLAIPDLGVGNEVTDILSGTNRLRAWWAGPTSYRVDRETVAAESDVYRNGRGLWTWDSDRRLAVFTVNKPQIPLPGPADGLPGTLARRLLEQAAAKDVVAVAPRRIAGRTAIGLTWKPNDPRSLIGQVTVWADQDNGAPLAVEVKAAGASGKAFSSSFLDVSFKAPDPARLTFHPHADSTTTVDAGQQNTRDDERPQALLPATIGGLPQRSPESPTVATYGQGATIVAITEIGDPIPALALRQQIDSPSRPPVKAAFGEGSLFQTPLLTGLVFVSKDRGYVLLGSVTPAELETMALDLVQHPPPLPGDFRRGRRHA